MFTTCLRNDDIDKLDELVEEDKANKYDSKDFKKDFKTKLEFDLKVLNK